MIRLAVALAILPFTHHPGVPDGMTPQQAERVGIPVEVTPPTLPTYQPGDCDGLRDLFVALGASDEELRFFIDRGIAWRESRCGLGLVNANRNGTVDFGPCQINSVHSQPGWAFGVRWGAGGWLEAKLGINHADTPPDDPQWVAACLILIRNGRDEPGVRAAYHWSATR